MLLSVLGWKSRFGPPYPVLFTYPTRSNFLSNVGGGVPDVAFLQPLLPPLWCNNGLVYLYRSLQFTETLFVFVIYLSPSDRLVR